MTTERIGRLYGYEVFIDLGHDVPIRKHRRRANGGKVNYHERVQKKWNKRYGTTVGFVAPETGMLRIGNGNPNASLPSALLMRVQTWDALKKAVASERAARTLAD